MQQHSKILFMTHKVVVFYHFFFGERGMPITPPPQLVPLFLWRFLALFPLYHLPSKFTIMGMQKHTECKCTLVLFGQCVWSSLEAAALWSTGRDNNQSMLPSKIKMGLFMIKPFCASFLSANCISAI